MSVLSYVIDGKCGCCAGADPCNCAEEYLTLEIISEDFEHYAQITPSCDDQTTYPWSFWKAPMIYGYVWSEEEDSMFQLVAIIRPGGGLSNFPEVCLGNMWGWTVVNNCFGFGGPWDQAGCNQPGHNCDYYTVCYTNTDCCNGVRDGSTFYDTPKDYLYPCYSAAPINRETGDSGIRSFKVHPNKKYGVAFFAEFWWHLPNPVCHDNVNYTWKITRGDKTDLDGDAVAEGGGQAHAYLEDNLLEHVSFVAP